MSRSLSSVDTVAVADSPSLPRSGTARISVVIPTKNEARNVAWVLERLPPSVDEIILVDGQSTDGTVQVARSVRPDLILVDEATPGKGAALRAGFRAARGTFVVMLDADGSMDPAEIDAYVAVLESGYDFVKGSRFMDGGGTTDMTWLRRVGNWGFVQMTNLLFGSRFSDLCYGYVAFRRSRLDDLALTAPGFEIETQLVIHAVQAGLRVTECPSFESPRRYGESNLQTFPDGWRVLKTIVNERMARTRPSPTSEAPSITPSVPASDPGFGESARARLDSGEHPRVEPAFSGTMAFSAAPLSQPLATAYAEPVGPRDRAGTLP